MGKKVKLICQARYGQVGSVDISYEMAQTAFGKMGIQTQDLGDGVLQYTILIDEEDPNFERVRKGSKIEVYRFEVTTNEDH